MEANESQIFDLQKEWRSIVLEKLSALERGQNNLRDKVDTIKEEFTTAEELNVLRLKVEILENFKYKLLGIFISAQCIIGLIILLLKK